MKKTIIFWLVSFILTIVLAFYQRSSGPTYPLTGVLKFMDNEYKYKFDRSHGGKTDHAVEFEINDSKIKGIVEWRLFKKIGDEWKTIEMKNENGLLTAYLPNQPPAGKIEYRVALIDKGEKLYITKENVIIRFKGDVPAWALIPHVVGMFGAMLLSARTALEFFNKQPQYKKLTLWTLGLIIVGGIIFGPIVQKFAFDAWWTGWPFGNDLTDNKTLAAFIAWTVAAVAVYKSKNPRFWVLAAAILLLITFMIPHSLLGSELNYNAPSSN